MQTAQADYFTAYHNVKLTRDANGVLTVQLHTNGGPCMMTAQTHTEFVEAFYRISQDRANKIVILTGAGGDFITDVDWSSWGNAGDPGVWSQIHDEGVQVLENIANIRVPLIAAIEGRAHIHSDYALLANVIVAAEGATFQDVGHYAAGVAPGDGIFTTWSYRAGEGADHVFITGRRKDALDAAVAEIGEKATGVPGDVGSLNDLDRLYESVDGYGRKIDVVFANAGVSQIATLGTVDEKFFDLHFDANVKGLFFTVQKALPLLKDGASIILNASIATIKGFPGISVYSATKAAVRSFARTWTNELRERHIRVNAISPGHIDTPIFDNWQKGEALTQLKEELAKNVPLGRLGDPDEIAKAVAFLASDEASYISGIELFVDGGVAQI